MKLNVNLNVKQNWKRTINEKLDIIKSHKICQYQHIKLHTQLTKQKLSYLKIYHNLKEVLK